MLDAGRCTSGSRMFYAARPWALPARAVYFFVGDPPPETLAGMVMRSADRRTLVTVPGSAVSELEQLYVRWDDAVALPRGYYGPGTALRLQSHGTSE